MTLEELAHVLHALKELDYSPLKEEVVTMILEKIKEKLKND